MPGERLNYNLPELDGFSGFYDFEVSLQNNGTLLTDDRPYNNLIRRKDIYIFNESPLVVQAIPEGTTPCLNTNTLWFLDIPEAISIDWYLQKTGGFSIHSGPYFHLFPISGNFTFYVEATLESNGGMINAQNTSIENANRGLSFDAKTSFTLKSVKVYNQTTGSRTIGLYDQNNNIIAEKTIDINTIGEVVLDLDFNVPQGRDFQLRLTNGQGLAVDEEPDFPYNLGGVAFITKSTALSNPQSKYYYFYDWVIHHVHACQRTPIHLEMQASENPPSAAFTPSATIVNIGALENIEFSNSSSNSVEYLWNFGDGTTSTEEHPQHSYSSPGLYLSLIHI